MQSPAGINHAPILAPHAPFSKGGNHFALVCWIRGGVTREAEIPEVPVLDVRVEVDGVVSHGVDGAFLFRELQLKVFQLGCAEIDADDRAFVQALVAFVALPPTKRPIPCQRRRPCQQEEALRAAQVGKERWRVVASRRLCEL